VNAGHGDQGLQGPSVLGRSGHHACYFHGPFGGSHYNGFLVVKNVQGCTDGNDCRLAKSHAGKTESQKPSRYTFHGHDSKDDQALMIYLMSVISLDLNQASAEGKPLIFVARR
jgi:hypothetical protein